MANSDHQTTTFRLLKKTKDSAKKILQAKGLTLTQYINLSLDKLVAISDLPFVESHKYSNNYEDSNKLNESRTKYNPHYNSINLDQQDFISKDLYLQVKSIDQQLGLDFTKFLEQAMTEYIKQNTYSIKKSKIAIHPVTIKNLDVTNAALNHNDVYDA